MARRRLLIVDDEPSLAGLMKRYLSRLGYDVDICGRGDEAWEMLAVPGSAYDLVVVDLTLPDQPGEVLLRRILARDPAARVLVCSGSPDGVRFKSESRVEFLQKPFVPSALARSVETLLAGDSDSCDALG